MNKKNKRSIIAIIILIIVIGLIIPVIVHLDSPSIISEITADGMLGYIIGYLSFITTGILALYALFQTKQSNDIAQKYNDMTNQLLDIEKNNYKLQIRPFIAITKYDIKKYTQSDILNSDDKLFIEVGNWDSISSINGITLKVTNTTESFLTFQFDEAEKIDSDIIWRNSSVGKNNIQNMKTSLMPGESREIVFIADDDFILNHFGKSVNLSFILENRFTNRYKETFKMIFTYISKNSDSIDLYLFFQEYHIYKFKYNNGIISEVEEEL